MSEEPSRSRRRLAAILHADVAGYSALMGADEAATQRALSSAMRLARETMAAHGGRIVSTAGDAFLAEFPSVVDAVSAAVAFQSRPAEQVGGEPLTFRIGINLGDILVEGDEVFGDGVNLAARTQALAPPGGIAITDAVQAQLGARSEIAFTDAGLHRVKNIAKPLRIHVASPPFAAPAAARPPAAPRRGLRRYGILALLLIALTAGGAVALLSGIRAPEAPPTDPATLAAEPRPVVAVLPFTEAGADETWFADGITEDVIAHLGRFPALLVLSWNAVAPYRGRTVELATLRDRLGARYVLGGSIRRSASMLRVAIELSDARDGLLIWSKRFESPFDDLFELQDEITGAVAGALAIGVARIEQRRTLAAPTDTLDAYELVLRGRAKSRRVDRAANLEARALFEQALAKDPDYPDALAGLAWTYIADAWWGWSEFPDAAIEKARGLLDEAISRDPRNVRAISSRAEALFLAGQKDAARADCDRAIEINPNDPSALGMCGSLRVFTDSPELGVPLLELSLRIDPEPTTWSLTNIALGYYVLGEYEKGVDVLGHGARGFDEDPSPHAVLAALSVRLGNLERARAEVEKTLRAYPFFDAEVFVNNFADPETAASFLADLRAAGFD